MERTLRHAKKPGAYALIIAAAALILGAAVVGVWSRAERLEAVSGYAER